MNNGVSTNSINPFTTWNFNKIWWIGSANSFISSAPNLTTDLLLVPRPTSSSDITLTNTRNSSLQLISGFTTGTSTTITPGTSTISMQGSFIGNTINTVASYSNSGVAGSSVISQTGNNEATGDLFINLVTLYLTFPSSIC